MSLDFSFGAQQADELLGALEEQLRARDARFELVLIGGTGLLALGLISRATTDVDVVALVGGGVLIPAEPLPSPLVEAPARVARDYGLGGGWLNAGPADILRFGLPEGFDSRLRARTYGPALIVHFASRFDQIHFKLYAMVDQGAGRHEVDLRALKPTRDELLAAARWARTHDPSEGFRQQLILALTHLGVVDADVGP